MGLSSEKAIQELFNFFDLHGEKKITQADLQEVLGAEVAETLGKRGDRRGNLDIERLPKQICKRFSVQKSQKRWASEVTEEATWTSKDYPSRFARGSRCRSRRNVGQAR